MRSIRHSAGIVICVLVLGLFFFSLSHAFFHAVHVDEIDWLQINSRALQDGLRMHHPMFQCEQRISWVIPWSLVPGRLFASAFHPADLIQFRIMSSLLYLGIIVALAAVARQLHGIGWPFALAGVAAVLTLGVMPYSMISFRPEAAIAFGLIAILLVYLLLKKGKLRLHPFVMLAGLLLFSSWFFSIHPKTLLFAPAILLVALDLPVRRVWSVAATLFLCFMLWQAYGMWDNYLYCPETPSIDAVHHAWAVRIGDFSTNPADWITRFSANLREMQTRYFQTVMFQHDYYGNCGVVLFSDLFPVMVLPLAGFIISVLLLCIVGFCIPALFMAIGSISRRQLSAQLPFFIIGLIGAGLFFLMGSKSGCSDYETPLVWPIGLLLVIACLSSGRLREYFATPLKMLLGLVLLVSIVSQTVLLSYDGPLARFNMQTHTDNGEFPGRDDRQSVVGYEVRAERISKAAKMCNISLGPESYRIVFDDFTYMAVRNTRLPLGAMVMYQGERGLDMLHYARHLGSDGILMRCSHVAPGLRGYTTEFEGFCCIGKDAMQNVP